MEKIGDVLKTYMPKPIEERGRNYWLNKFFYRLEKDWGGVQQLTRLRVGVALKKFPNWELPVLWKVCEQSDNFSLCFWWKAKNQEAPKKVRKPSNLKLFK